MLKVDDDPNLLETIKQSNPKLNQIAMSVAEQLRQEGEKKGIQKGKQEGIRIGEEKGKLEEKLAIAKAMLQEGESIDKIIRFTGLSRSQIHDLV